MPIQIDRKRAENLAPQFDEALELVRNEFERLDPHRQYRNAFARLLKPDPLGRCLLYTSPSPRDRQKSRMPSSA